jgi:hypothetical protein
MGKLKKPFAVVYCTDGEFFANRFGEYVFSTIVNLNCPEFDKMRSFAKYKKFIEGTSFVGGTGSVMGPFATYEEAHMYQKML